MKKGWKLGFVLLLISGLLLGCSANNDETEDAKDIHPIEVTIELPEKGDVNEEIELKAIVTQNKEKVADADEVMFEVWEDGKKDESTMVEGTNNEDGTYTAPYTFDRDGVFVVQAHVTARGMHNMPKQTITIGNPTNEMAHHDQMEEGLSVHWMEPEMNPVGKPIELIVHVNKDGQPVENATVKFTIINEANKEIAKVDGEMSAIGEYKGTVTLEQEGHYKVLTMVHSGEDMVEKEEILHVGHSH
jgi:YtkA-like